MTATHRKPESGGAESASDAYERIYNSSDFKELRHRFRSFVFPVTAGFLAWYALYVLIANYNHKFMGTKVVGNINVGLVFGLLQFVSTFGIAWWYSRKAERDFDPLSSKLLRDFEETTR